MKNVFINSTIQKRILKLAIDFCEESMIPGRYKPKKDRSNRRTIIREDSKVEVYFKQNLSEWEEMVYQLLNSDLNKEHIHRLIYLQLDPEDSYETLTDCYDWNIYNDYLIYRRDEMNCSDGELGKLCMLIGAYQKLVERKISRNKGLKNDIAQQLLDAGSIEIDGHLIQIWKGHSRSTVETQESWNKVGSMAEMNEGKMIDSPRICFTGVFQIPRQEIMSYASALGFHVQTGVNGKTNLFVFGSENVGPNKIADLI